MRAVKYAKSVQLVSSTWLITWLVASGATAPIRNGSTDFVYLAGRFDTITAKLLVVVE